MNDLAGLIVGPLFVVAKLGFLVGLRKEVQEAIEQRSWLGRVGGGLIGWFV